MNGGVQWLDNDYQEYTDTTKYQDWIWTDSQTQPNLPLKRAPKKANPISKGIKPHQPVNVEEIP